MIPKENKYFFIKFRSLMFTLLKTNFSFLYKLFLLNHMNYFFTVASVLKRLPDCVVLCVLN